MSKLSAFFVGLLFGLGLLLSGMTDPGKVQGFLDLAGAWDPSLAFVMGGAIGVGLLPFGLAARRTRTYLGEAMRLPKAKEIDRRLVLGSLTFGVGWGLAGFCPGPGLVSMASGQVKGLVFVVAMVVGMLVFEWAERPGAPQGPRTHP
ncbi:MAG: YeeE/YedE family protein [Hydrogenophaga sp.]|nr:YeeE/YedE family protein [Hydrogenophaga sp.]